MGILEKEKINSITEFAAEFYPDGFVNRIKKGFGGDYPLYGFRNFLKYELFPFLYHNKISDRLLLTYGKEINSLDFVVFGLLAILNRLGEEDRRDLMVDFHLAYDTLDQVQGSAKEALEIIMPIMRSDQRELVNKVLAHKFNP